MSSNNTRRVFVNVLVNGNSYQKNVAIDTPTNITYPVSEFINNWILINYGGRIPKELLSYEIVSEVSEKQRALLIDIQGDISVSIGEGQSDFEGGKVQFINDALVIEKKGIVYTIHAKDIVIKE